MQHFSLSLAGTNTLQFVSVLNGTCKSHHFEPLDKTFLITLTRTASQIELLTTQICAEGAQTLFGQIDQPITVETSDNYPYGCYYYEGEVYYNKDTTSKRKCSVAEPCVCTLPIDKCTSASNTLLETNKLCNCVSESNTELCGDRTEESNHVGFQLGKYCNEKSQCSDYPDCSSRINNTVNTELCYCQWHSDLQGSVPCTVGGHCHSDGYCQRSASCQHQDGISPNKEPCYCGKTECVSRRYCKFVHESSENMNNRIGICQRFASCQHQDGISPNMEPCYCGKTGCVSGDYCSFRAYTNENMNNGTGICRQLKPCTFTDGLTKNTGKCSCGGVSGAGAVTTSSWSTDGATKTTIRTDLSCGSAVNKPYCFVNPVGMLDRRILYTPRNGVPMVLMPNGPPTTCRETPYRYRFLGCELGGKCTCGDWGLAEIASREDCQRAGEDLGGCRTHDPAKTSKNGELGACNQFYSNMVNNPRTNGDDNWKTGQNWQVIRLYLDNNVDVCKAVHNQPNAELWSKEPTGCARDGTHFELKFKMKTAHPQTYTRYNGESFSQSNQGYLVDYMYSSGRVGICLELPKCQDGMNEKSCQCGPFACMNASNTGLYCTLTGNTPISGICHGPLQMIVDGEIWDTSIYWASRVILIVGLVGLGVIILYICWRKCLSPKFHSWNDHQRLKNTAEAEEMRRVARNARSLALDERDGSDQVGGYEGNEGDGTQGIELAIKDPAIVERGSKVNKQVSLA